MKKALSLALVTLIVFSTLSAAIEAVTAESTIPTYLSTTFVGLMESSQITVPLNSLVRVKVKLHSETTISGTLHVEIRKDIIDWFDSQHKMLSKDISLSLGTNEVDMGYFRATDLSGSMPFSFREYFVRVYWNGLGDQDKIYDPTDPELREWVKTKKWEQIASDRRIGYVRLAYGWAQPGFFLLDTMLTYITNEICKLMLQDLYQQVLDPLTSLIVSKIIDELDPATKDWKDLVGEAQADAILTGIWMGTWWVYGYESEYLNLPHDQKTSLRNELYSLYTSEGYTPSSWAISMSLPLSTLTSDFVMFELDFMGYLVRQELIAWQNNDKKLATEYLQKELQFLNNHLKWISDMSGVADPSKKINTNNEYYDELQYTTGHAIVKDLEFLEAVADPSSKGYIEEGVTTNPVPPGCAKIDFEEGTEGEVIKSTIAGLRFTTTLGYDWVYSDIRTGTYNARSLTDPSVNFGDYVVNGYFAAWLGIYAGQGRIDFILGPASYFSVLTSTYSGLQLEAYDSNDNLVATSGWVEGNLFTYTFTRLTVAAEGIAYVIIHDTGNYWEIDDIVTDAPAWGSEVSSESVKKIPQRFEMSLITGDWITPNSKIEIDISDIAMRTADVLTELTPQDADNLLANFAVVLKDRNGDGKITSEEILQNILEQIPEEITKQYAKFIIEQISSLNLEMPSPNYSENLMTQIFNFGSTVADTVSTYGPYAIAVIALPVGIATGFTTYGLGGYQAITGIYVPTNALLGTGGEITVAMYSHGDLVMIDPEGRIVCKEFSELLGGRYIEVDLNGDGVLDDVIILPPTATIDYTIDIVPDETATPDDTFTLTMASLGIYFNLVRGLSFPDVPEHGFGLQSSMPPTDSIHPSTTLTIDEPKYVDGAENIYVTSDSPFTLNAEDDPGGTGVASTAYRIYNGGYDSGWLTYSESFYLTGITDGPYYIDYYSTDVVGNVEPTNTIDVTLDNIGPEIAVWNPPAGCALQDGVTFKGSIVDAESGVSSMCFSIREANGGEGIPIGFEDLPVSYNPNTGEWSFSFDTLLVPDGYYVLYIEAEDNLGNGASTTVPYSIRNWAVLELLPASEKNKARRTMPVKFALRVAATVDPLQPFVYNEELVIDIYATDQPDDILQESTFGDHARDYRINSSQELYITNFRTLRTPKEYRVEVYRKDMLIDSFTFETVK